MNKTNENKILNLIALILSRIINAAVGSYVMRGCKLYNAIIMYIILKIV
jgi:hypothetical protein